MTKDSILFAEAIQKGPKELRKLTEDTLKQDKVLFEVCYKGARALCNATKRQEDLLLFVHAFAVNHLCYEWQKELSEKEITL